MTLPQRLKLIGAPGSPYTRKMLALLRYRHIVHDIVWGDPSRAGAGLPKANVKLHPTFYFKDRNGELEAVVDSTPIIRRLEQEQQGRSVIPGNPALAFINYLLEDFGDEWCTKYMFHYRWSRAADIDWAGTMIPLWMDRTIPEDQLIKFKQAFSERQISRIGIVGSNKTTQPIIEGSYQRFLGLLEQHFRAEPFLLGKRPGSGDFAVYGQLTQLVSVDPTPAALAREISPRSCAWVDCMEDLSGLEPQDSDWVGVDAIPQSLTNILSEIGRVYVPALLANARALIAGEKNWQAQIDGCRWTQQSFPYQGKCLKWINQEYQALARTDKQAVDAVLAGTGCEALIPVEEQLRS